MMNIDASLYPDVDQPPKALDTPELKADYLHRVCSAWDFYIMPEPETFDLLKQWKEVFDRFPLNASPAYHALRAWFGWDSVPAPSKLALQQAQYQILDELEGRGEDECTSLV